MTVARMLELRAAGNEEAALSLARELAAAAPADAGVRYEVASLLDYLGLEAEAVPHYVAAIDAGLPDEKLHCAFLGLGSTYRALGRYAEALATLDRGLQRFPDASDLLAFRAMTLFNNGRAKEAVQDLLRVVARTTNDAELARYRRALELYAEDLDRRW